MILKNIKAFMIDLDGVVYLGDNAVDGAADTINFLMKKYRCLFVTNTVSRNKQSLINKLHSFGIETKEADFVTALSATIDYIKSKKKDAHCYIIGSDEAKKEFENNGLIIDEEIPDFVVVGWDRKLTYDILNKAFRLTLSGAKLVATQIDRSAPMDDGLYMLAGPLVRALEYATNTKAIVIGKPTLRFFLVALRQLGTRPEETIMVGDNMESDIVGAKKIGMKTILIGRRETKQKIKPDMILNSISELPRVLK